ncbi:THO complex subunit 1 transcription elongation factor-domain-containing protein [Piptocephalis cylindrospora]|uniref:THO complex subunit 1 transcription elongation factor-domain-containing protein n=1 Tax=Piptocephalis cylindrospora TaxID=1907219 RepID=A0A4P9Y5N6_9FUNG|nr:THO complex subunit 1 transcription elongation factor-domain-containing protein [Piptocephalis cylindrospora]|eukprot:RKP13110.1 THO complex subunit 1 transcription elongation factor-domain-containing protein [Piptocephalis cylindrospora]
MSDKEAIAMTASQALPTSSSPPPAPGTIAWALDIFTKASLDYLESVDAASEQDIAISSPDWETITEKTNTMIRPVYTQALEKLESSAFTGPTLALAIENILTGLVEKGKAISSLYHLLDLAIILVDLDLCDADLNPNGKTLPHRLLLSLLSILTITDCSRLFSYMESRASKLTQGMIVGRLGRATELIRIGNELLRRLSKATESDFRGRIHLFLARIFPLEELSGLNNLGKVNLSNDLSWEESAKEEGQGSGNGQEGKEDKGDSSKTSPKEQNLKSSADTFYQTFWKLQERLRNPAMALSAEAFPQFMIEVEVVVRRFEDIQRVEAEKRIFPQPLPQPASVEDGYFPKYLTAKQLLPLELRDPRFRRQCMVQLYISLTVASSHDNAERRDRQGFAVKRMGRIEYVLTNDEGDWAWRMQKRVRDLLWRQKPHESELEQAARIVMRSELQWSTWKNQGCPSRSPPNDMDLTAGSGARKLIGGLKRRLPPMMKPYRLHKITMTDALYREHVDRSAEPALESLILEHKRQFTRPDRVVERLAPFEGGRDDHVPEDATMEESKKTEAPPMKEAKEPNDVADEKDTKPNTPKEEAKDEEMIAETGSGVESKAKSIISPSVPSTPTTPSAPTLPPKRPTPGTLSVFPWAREGLDEEKNRELSLSTWKCTRMAVQASLNTLTPSMVCHGDIWGIEIAAKALLEMHQEQIAKESTGKKRKAEEDLKEAEGFKKKQEVEVQEADTKAVSNENEIEVKGSDKNMEVEATDEDKEVQAVAVPNESGATETDKTGEGESSGRDETKV